MKKTARILALAAALSSLFHPIEKGWAVWPAGGSAVCTAVSSQVSAVAAPDGAGGIIVAWRDLRGGGAYDIYAQRLDASGKPRWTSDGVAVCLASNDQTGLAIVPDGAGGAILAWEDLRFGTYTDIYVQRIDANGVPSWGMNGLLLCSAAFGQSTPTLAPDGAGGAIVAWADLRSSVYDIYAQRVSASGAALWTANGIPVCTSVNSQEQPRIVADGAGGAVLSWQDLRGAADLDIYAQRVNSSGAALWTANGVALCTAGTSQQNSRIVSDGTGGAIVVWEDSRNGAADIFAQRVNASGAVEWTPNGVTVCTAVFDQSAPEAVSDGAGGMVVAWNDVRGGYANDVYAQRLNGAGTALWTANGNVVCAASGFQYYPKVASDGAGGAIVAWFDVRSGWHDIYAQRVDASGSVRWIVDGVALCTAPDDQFYPQVVSDGAGGAAVAWYDSRSGTYDIYAQAIDSSARPGYLAPKIVAVRDVPGDQGGSVYLSWNASAADFCQNAEMARYSVWRAIGATAAGKALDAGGLLLEDPASFDPKDAAHSGPVVRMEKTEGGPYYWELAATVYAYYRETYGVHVATLFDSTSTSTERHRFQVVAHTTDPTLFWMSDPDSGRSVDNLAPAAPIHLDLYGAQAIRWNRNKEADLRDYAVYISADSSGSLEAADRLGSTSDTTFTLPDSSAGYYVIVTAFDVHENESRPSNIVRNITGAPEGGAPASYFLARVVPNPFNPSATIRFGIPEGGPVRLAVHDLAGAEVAVLDEGVHPAGTFTATWNGRNGSGAEAPSGVYFARLEAGTFVATRKMVLIR